MPYHNALKELNKKRGYNLDNGALWTYISSVVMNDRAPAETDKQIETRIKDLFEQDSARYERYRQQLFMRYQAKPGNKRMEAEAGKLLDVNGFAEHYIEMANIMVQAANAAKRQYCREHNRTFVPHQPIAYFGISGAEMTALKEKQLNGYSNRDARKFEIFEAHGVKSQKFLNELNDTKGIQYNTATSYEKNILLKTYMTKKLFEEHLKSKNFLWKAIFRGQTKAMKNYIRAAENALNDAKFYTVSQETRDADLAAYEKMGWAYDGDAKAFDETFKESEARIDKEVSVGVNQRSEEAAKKEAAREQKRLEKENAKNAERMKKSNELKAKMEPSQKEVDAVNALDPADRLFEVRFRPSFDLNEFTEQYELAKTVYKRLNGLNLHQDEKAFFKSSFLPKGVKTVFNANFQKLMDIKTYVRSKGTMSDAQIEEMETKYTDKFIDAEDKLQKSLDTLEGYKPLTHKEFENLAMQEELRCELASSEKGKTEVSPKNEEKQVSKEPLSADRK